MHPKIKARPAAATKTANRLVKPPLLHDVTNQTAAANTAARRPILPNLPASGAANHARHHVSQSEQG